MSMNFKIVEQKTINYYDAKNDYLNGIMGKELRKKYHLGDKAYASLLQRFREDGLEIEMAINNRKRQRKKRGKYYYISKQRGHIYWTVKKFINNKLYYFGNYKTEAEAKKRVMELEANNWEGLLQ